MNVEVETLITLLAIAALAALLARALGGFTLAGLLATYLLACLGAVGGWVAEQRLGLPPLYAIPLPGGAAAPIIWPGAGALLAALLSARLWRPTRRPARRSRRT
jgi:hypothetical protein